MHFRFFVILLNGLFFSACVSADNPPKVVRLAENLTVSPLTENSYLVTHTFPWPANSILARMSTSDYVLVDTPWENKASEQLYDWLRQQTDFLRLIVINSHFHRDNLGGNDFFLRQQVPVYGSETTVCLLEESRSAGAAAEAALYTTPEQKRCFNILRQTPLKPPDHKFPLQEGLQLTIAGEPVEIFYPGAGHTKDNIVVYFPQRRLLFGGCLVKSMESQTLGNLQDADVPAWPASLNRLFEKFPQAEIVIPGHGAPGDLRLIQHTLDLVNAYLTPSSDSRIQSMQFQQGDLRRAE